MQSSTKHPKIVVYSIKDKVVGVQWQDSTSQTQVTQKSRPCTLILARVGVGAVLELSKSALGGWIGSRDLTLGG